MRLYQLTAATIFIISSFSVFAGDKFTKISVSGAELPDSATEWSCVKQNASGLIWEVKTDDGGFRDKDWTYSWYNSDPFTNDRNPGTENNGSCDNNADCDTEKYTKRVNNHDLCGFNDWRVPTKPEIESIRIPISFSQSFGGPWIFSDGSTSTSRDFYAEQFPNTKVDLPYWSITSSSFNSSSSAWYFIFGSSYPQDADSKSSGNYVRLVAGPSLYVQNIQSDADKLFDWAEDQYSHLFSPANQKSKTYDKFWYYRYYKSTNNYVAVNTIDLTIYAIWGNTSNEIIRLDTLKALMPNAGLNNSLEYIGSECVTINGLMWEVKDNNRGLQDIDNTYTWFDPTLPINDITVNLNNSWAGVADGGRCVESKCDTAHFIEAVNARSLCGYNNWRLPTQDELKALGNNDSSPRIELDNGSANHVHFEFWAEEYSRTMAKVWQGYQKPYQHYAIAVGKGWSSPVRLVRDLSE